MPASSAIGFNLIGYTSAAFGIGVAARNTATILTRCGYPVSIFDLPLEGNRSNIDRTFDHLRLPGGARLPHPITIFHVNPRAMAAALAARPSWLPVDRGFLAAVPFWELPALPDSWTHALAGIDLVLAPSRFIENTLANHCPPDKGPLVRHYAQTAFLPGNVAPNRAAFGLPEGSVLFALGFDAASDLDRKNPWGAIEAFGRAFTNGDNARLVVKVNDSCPTAASRSPTARLGEAAAANRAIVVIDKPMTYTEVLSLYASCDVYVSLHRAEGLGLCPMEAMLLGRPVIATGWSGVMDFMTDGNSCLVGSAPVAVSSPLYLALLSGRRTVWAEPDLDEAALWMRRLFANATLRSAIGARARETMEARQKECLEGEIFSEVVEIYKRKCKYIN